MLNTGSSKAFTQDENMLTYRKYVELLRENSKTTDLYDLLHKTQVKHVSARFYIEVPTIENYKILDSLNTNVIPANQTKLKLNTTHSIVTNSTLVVEATGEYMSVVDVLTATNEINVRRGINGTVPSAIDLVAASGLRRLGNANPEGSGPNMTYSNSGIKVTNHVQITRQDTSLTGTAKTLVDRHGYKRNHELKGQASVFKELGALVRNSVERDILYSRFGEVIQSGMPKRSTSGIIEQSKYNGFALADGKLTPSVFTLMMYRLNRYTFKNNINSDMTIFGCHKSVAGYFSEMLRNLPDVGISASENVIAKWGFTCNKLVTPYGDVHIVPLEFMEQGSGLFFKPDHIEIEVLRDQFSFASEIDKGNTQGIDAEIYSMIIEWMVNVKNPYTTAYVEGIKGWIGDYSAAKSTNLYT